jgi:hypothetical protein
VDCGGGEVNALHMVDAATELVDEYGRWAQVLCGEVGGYYSSNMGGVTCPECRRLGSWSFVCWSHGVVDCVTCDSVVAS